ncbi:hypothetical protein DFQ26_004797 [Actinomortierella ambigua]|nr:hypothetical protein DFQ26_004797 [Actinomortierella ambigua]
MLIKGVFSALALCSTWVLTASGLPEDLQYQSPGLSYMQDVNKAYVALFKGNLDLAASLYSQAQREHASLQPEIIRMLDAYDTIVGHDLGIYRPRTGLDAAYASFSAASRMFASGKMVGARKLFLNGARFLYPGRSGQVLVDLAENKCSFLPWTVARPILDGNTARSSEAIRKRDTPAILNKAAEILAQVGQGFKELAGKGDKNDSHWFWVWVERIGEVFDDKSFDDVKMQTYVKDRQQECTFSSSGFPVNVFSPLDVFGIGLLDGLGNNDVQSALKASLDTVYSAFAEFSVNVAKAVWEDSCAQKYYTMPYLDAPCYFTKLA